MTVQKKMSESVAEFRRFSRFYTKQIGLLAKGFLKTRFSLTQARILYELANHEQLTASDIINELGIDPGHLSRILNNFEKEGLLHKVRSKSDSRRRILNLTPQGQNAFSVLNERSMEEAEGLLLRLTREERRRLLNAMQAIENILGDDSKPPTSYLLRFNSPGDIGWIIHRHGVLYSEEYGFDETFEALVAEILVQFIRKHDPKRECIWIAEQDGERVGAVMIVDAGEQIAQLRLLLVEPRARGSGIGKQLINECIKFSRRNRYRKIKLWTQSNLLEARHLYAKADFKMVEEYPHKSFGLNLIAEFWELSLQD
jgi:DNA-binding MarR family transcriptional regulator/N-acetylglutamate synthase-like GNAT family acetyltransferase